MSLIQTVCPNCGGSTQIEAGLRAMCPYCGSELNALPPDSGAAFAQDVQFAQTPVQQAEQVQQAETVQQDNPAAYMYPPFSAPKPVRQYPPEQLTAADKKRHTWYAGNIAALAAQSLVLAIGMWLCDYYYSEVLGPLMILVWLVSLPVWAVISAKLRPDAAYLNTEPMLKSKKAQAVMHTLLSAPASALTAGMLLLLLMILHAVLFLAKLR